MKEYKKKFAGAILLAGTAFSLNQAQAQTCIIPPTCEELGYTQTEEDCNGADVVLKCPTDMTKMACLDSTASQNVAVGAILYGDGTVANGLVTSKQPIGVLFDDINRLALALTDVKKDGSAGSDRMSWSSSYCDTPNLENCTDSNTITISCGTDGRANTDVILTSWECSAPYVTKAVNAYSPNVCSKDFCKVGKWFLPSIRDLNNIYSFKGEINSKLTLLVSFGASLLTEDDDKYYWSSTEYGKNNAWALVMNNGDKRHPGKSYSGYVRPVLAF